jgi:hypothetical protein
LVGRLHGGSRFRRSSWIHVRPLQEVLTIPESGWTSGRLEVPGWCVPVRQARRGATGKSRAAYRQAQRSPDHRSIPSAMRSDASDCSPTERSDSTVEGDIAFFPTFFLTSQFDCSIENHTNLFSLPCPPAGETCSCAKRPGKRSATPHEKPPADVLPD